MNKPILASELDDIFDDDDIVEIKNNIEDNKPSITKYGIAEITDRYISIKEKESDFVIFWYDYCSNIEENYDSATLELATTFGFYSDGFINIVDKNNNRIIFSIPTTNDYDCSNNDYAEDFPHETSFVFEYNDNDAPKLPNIITNNLEVVVNLYGEKLEIDPDIEDLSYKSNRELADIVFNNFEEITGECPECTFYREEYNEDDWDSREDYDRYIERNGDWEWDQVMCDYVYREISEWLSKRNISDNDIQYIEERVEELIIYRCV